MAIGADSGRVKLIFLKQNWFGIECAIMEDIRILCRFIIRRPAMVHLMFSSSSRLYDESATPQSQ